MRFHWALKAYAIHEFFTITVAHDSQKGEGTFRKDYSNDIPAINSYQYYYKK